jgi:arylsulfatase A-like enzyme
MSKKRFPNLRPLFGRLGLILALAAPLSLLSAAEKPNIIFILTDDYGWADLGCYGSTFYETPNLDRLASQGTRFTDAYAACNVCSPTRASILTGKYPARLNLTDWLPGRSDRPDQKLNRPVIRQFLPLEEVTLAEAFKEAGYRTGFFGKWHLGEEPKYYPEHQGFDVNLGGCGKGHPPSYFSPYNIPTLKDGPKGEYLNDRLTDEVIDFMEKSKDQPFLVYLSHYAVHTPLQAKPDDLAKYKTKATKMKTKAPRFGTERGVRVRLVQDHPVYGAMVDNMDQSVGRVMDKLDELGLADRTIVIFTSDNGGLSINEGTPTSNLPLRAGKGWAYDGGVREPLIVRWPGVSRPGSVSAAPIISTDYYPTLLEMAGLPLRPEQHVDGRSFVPLLKGENLPEKPLFWHYPHYSNQGGSPNGVIRLGDFKLVEWFEDSRTELFNLKSDIGEQHDLSATMPEKTAELTRRLHQWRLQVGARMPTPNPNYRKTPISSPAKGKIKAR